MGRVKPIDQTIDIDELMREIERYLAAVEVFRAAGCDVGGIRRRRVERELTAARHEYGFGPL
jgi:5-carboxymethyl-2-hydroxymuconate isomerase